VLEEARRGATMQSALPELWQIERALGQAYQSLQQEEQAQRTFTAAREVINQLAQNIDELPLREQFVYRALGSLPQEKPPSPHQTTQNAFGLTGREHAVALMIAQGKSNREIADILAVSRRTIEAHARNLSSKLGFTSRAQIVVWATEQGLMKTEG
jgi:DNA-binding NarL/FixJ family response regulator